MSPITAEDKCWRISFLKWICAFEHSAMYIYILPLVPLMYWISPFVLDILSALDNDNFSVLLLLDLSAAFDTLDHQILLSSLNSVSGIQSTALQWFHSYLSDRYQSTSVNNLSSSPSQLMYGVPQGSVLGPILFVLYTTPLSDSIANHSVNHPISFSQMTHSSRNPFLSVK